ncbi:FMN-dependent alpha-hydroxy acid dehydrogenase family protein [Pleurotus pulmonarius]
MTAPETAVGPKKWSAHMIDIYSRRNAYGPILGTVSPAEIEAKAKEARKEYPGSFMYAGGSAGTNSTYAANLNIFDQYKLIPRMLVDATNRNLETTLFGVKYPSPILLAPIGVQGVCHADGELGSARAASKLGVPFIMSSASSRSIEDTAKASGSGPRWYQLYWPRSNDVTLSLLSRVKANGFTALVVTLDTFLLGWRPHDLQDSYLPFFHGIGVQVGTSDPVFMARYGRQPITDIPEFPYDPKKLDAAYANGDEKVKDAVFFGMEYLKETNSGLFRKWEDLKFLRDNWDGPLVLKGIQSVGDAEKAIECGVDGIIVSNHGGRQIDGAIPSLYALDKIMQSSVILEAQKSGKLTVLFDSGIRTGSDIIKALALGAQGVLLARPYLYGLMIGGQDGVEEVIKNTLADLEISMGLVGFTGINEIIGSRDKVLLHASKL